MVFRRFYAVCFERRCVSSEKWCLKKSGLDSEALTVARAWRSVRVSAFSEDAAGGTDDCSVSDSSY